MNFCRFARLLVVKWRYYKRFGIAGVYEMLSKMTFAEIKSEYNNRREEERKKIIDFLARQKDEEGRPLFYKADGKSYDNRPYAGGQGLSRYGSGRFKTAYDLRNWKWVATSCNGIYVLISLQAFDIDPGDTKNLHVLYDRLGICIGTGCNEKTVVNGRTISTMFLKMQNTDFELPLSESDLSELADYIKERCQNHKMP